MSFSELNNDLSRSGHPQITQQEYDRRKAKRRQKIKQERIQAEKDEKNRQEAKQKARKKRYDDYMKSDEWDRKRKIVLEEAGYKCQTCDDENVPLDVHHLIYRHFMREQRGELAALCVRCHKIADRIRKLYIKGKMGQ